MKKRFINERLPGERSGAISHDLAHLAFESRWISQEFTPSSQVQEVRTHVCYVSDIRNSVDNSEVEQN